MIGKYYTVLDKGFVGLKNQMGTDEDIDCAARVSYAKGTRKLSDTRGLIRYLVRERHTSPIEQVEFVFHIKIPLVIFGQMVRTRTASLNVQSYRYSEVPDEIYYPEQERYLKQSPDNKQGSSEELIFPGTEESDEYDEFDQKQRDNNYSQFEIYEELIQKGCSREVARLHLPQSVYTQLYWKMDLHNLLHFLKLRLDPHAQWEIREYARIVAGFVKHYCPITWEAFEDYQLYSRSFTQDEIRLLQSDMTPEDIEMELGSLGYKKREITGFWDKLKPAKKIDFTLE